MPKGKYSDDVRKYINEHCLGTAEKDLLKQIKEATGYDMTLAQLHNYKKYHKLKNGMIGSFRKGHKSVTCLTKGQYFPGSEKGWFKKGQVHPKSKPLGAEKVQKDGYTYIKVQLANGKTTWKLKQRYIWEQLHGPLPKGRRIIFADGDKSNFDIDNLICLTGSESIKLATKGYCSKYPEITKAGVMLIKVENAVREKSKNK